MDTSEGVWIDNCMSDQKMFFNHIPSFTFFSSLGRARFSPDMWETCGLELSLVLWDLMLWLEELDPQHLFSVINWKPCMVNIKMRKNWNVIMTFLTCRGRTTLYGYLQIQTETCCKNTQTVYLCSYYTFQWNPPNTDHAIFFINWKWKSQNWVVLFVLQFVYLW